MPMKTAGFSFTVSDRDGRARRARLSTPRASIETPVFMPVGTAATVKGLDPVEIESTGARIILANTYHLWLRPGPERIEALGGVPSFMAWPHAMLTDSGGFQVFSLAKLNEIDDDGVSFRSHLDGSRMRMTPEVSMQVQAALGADIAMAFDECPPGQAERKTIERAMRRTTGWAKRCLAVPAARGQARFGIVQGGVHVDLRRSHLDEISAMDFDGVALGGFSVGEPPEAMFEALAEVAPDMPEDRPRYLMGVGTPKDILLAIQSGIDMFDCVLPTRNGRNGQALTWGGRVNIRQAIHKSSDAPLDSRCPCPTCQRFSRAYLHHLFRAKEMLGPRLVTLHNLCFYGQLVAAARDAISRGAYDDFVKTTLAEMEAADEVGPADATAGPWRAPGTK